MEKKMNAKQRKKFNGDVNFLVGHIIIGYDTLKERLEEIDKTTFSDEVKQEAKRILQKGN